LYRLLDTLAARVKGPERLVVSTLTIEQPLYPELYAYMSAQGWVK
jgi:hypothetical protein